MRSVVPSDHFIGVGCSGKAVKSLLANQKHKFQVSNGTLATKHANAKSATSTPTKAMGSDKVISGRVGKSSAAKTKKSAKAKVKHEDSEDEDMGRLVTPPESAEEAMEVKRSSPRTPKKIIDYLAFGNGSDDDQTLHAASGDDSGSEFDVKTHIKADVDAE